MTKLTRHICLFSSVFILSVSTSSVMAKEYYKWVDAKGSTHYTKTPPPKNAKKQGRVETFGTKSSTVATTPAPQNEQMPAVNNQESSTSNTPIGTAIPVEATQPLK